MCRPHGVCKSAHSRVRGRRPVRVHAQPLEALPGRPRARGRGGGQARRYDPDRQEDARAHARVHDLETRLPSLTRGEGVLESAFDHYRPVGRPLPERPRTDHNPLDRREYLLHVQRRV